FPTRRSSDLITIREESVRLTTRGTRIAFGAGSDKFGPSARPGGGTSWQVASSGLLRKRGSNGQGVVHEAAEFIRRHLPCTLQRGRRAPSNGRADPRCSTDWD